MRHTHGSCCAARSLISHGKIHREQEKKHLTTLVDSGSSHSFIDTKITQSMVLDTKVTNSIVNMASSDLLIKTFGKRNSNHPVGPGTYKKIFPLNW